jgi:minimal CRISPR polymerase domain
MEDIKPGSLFISVDGDSIGAKVGRAVIANDIDELHSVSARIDAAQDFILHWCEQVGGTKISGGGDEATMAIPPEEKNKIKDLRQSIEKAFGYTISVGVGRNLSEAGTALLVAKLRGKDRIVYFNKHIKEDIKKAKRRVREKRASQEEYKLSEAYLEKAENMGKICELHKKELHKTHVHALHKSEEGKHAPHTEPNTDDPCPYCADNEDNRTDDCAYCQDLDAEENADGTAGMHDCPACKDYDEVQQNTGGIDDCPYCQTENITETQADPAITGTAAEQGAEDHHRCNCPNCPKNDQTNLAVEDMAAQKPDDCPQCQEMYSDAVENEPGQTGEGDPALQGHETAEEVLDLLDQEPGTGAQTPAQEAKKIDNTEMPQGDAMKENASVKENFGDSQKKDISDADKDFQQSTQTTPDQPDMTGVLQSGLDDHADEQKKQQVLDMVGQTLAGFKANKASLEATKEQNQALYNSCIQMLKSMISLCDLLGLKPQASLAPEATPEAPQATPAQPPSAAPPEGAANSPKI